MREAAAPGVGLRREDRLSRRVVERVVEPRDHPRGIAEGGMRGDVLHALAVNPDFAIVAQALEILLTRERSHHVCPSSSLARCSHSATKRKTFSAGGWGAKVSSHRTGALLTFANACTQPTPVQSTSPAAARYVRPSSVASTSPLRMKYASSNVWSCSPMLTPGWYSMNSIR